LHPGANLVAACRSSLAEALTDDGEMLDAMLEGLMWLERSFFLH
jgi:hypothetical protein